MSEQSVFVSYCHKDAVWMHCVVKQLRVVTTQVKAWSDEKIGAGEPWETAINRAIDEAHVAVLLISADSLTSEFIRDKEIPRLLDRHKTGKVKLYPIILLPCPWKLVPWLAALQCRPAGGQPLATYGHADEIKVAEQVMKMVVEVAGLLGEGAPTEAHAASGKTVLELLSELVTGGTVAHKPADLEAATRTGMAAIDEALKGLRLRGTKPEFAEVIQLTGLAISHGAGIYNHSLAGRIACARIYHRAATGLLLLLPAPAAGPTALPPRGALLAVQWLQCVVGATPQFREEGAEELAWALRYVFDAIQVITICDGIRNALGEIVLDEPRRRRAACDVLRQIQAMCGDIEAKHVSAYVLRHAAQVLAAVAAARPVQDRRLVAWCASVEQAITKYPWLTPANSEDAAGLFDELLEEASRELSSNGSPADRKWFNPRDWFSAN